MAQTKALLTAKLPTVLADLVLGYFCSPARDSWSVAASGEYESALRAYILSAAMRGACRGDYLDLARELGQKLSQFADGPAFGRGLANALEGDSLECARLMIVLGANNMSNLLEPISKSDRFRFMELILQHSPNLAQPALELSCRNLAPHCMRVAIQRGAAHCDQCGYSAARHNSHYP